MHSNCLFQNHSTCNVDIVYLFDPFSLSLRIKWKIHFQSIFIYLQWYWKGFCWNVIQLLKWQIALSNLDSSGNRQFSCYSRMLNRFHWSVYVFCCLLVTIESALIKWLRVDANSPSSFIICRYCPIFDDTSKVCVQKKNLFTLSSHPDSVAGK